MKIEKLDSVYVWRDDCHWDCLEELRKKINELIDAFTENESNRSEQMARFIDHIQHLENQIDLLKEGMVFPISVKKSEELKSCPFCGEIPQAIKSQQGDWDIECENDDCDVVPGTDWHETKEQAIKVWNIRV